jgi:anthranilate phosphoribosyltransferase
VHGSDGMDELSISAPSMIWEVRTGEAPRRFEIEPTALGLQPAPREALLGGTVEANVQTIRGLLEGEQDGPRRDVVLLNAAAGLVAADRAGDLREGLSLAADSLRGGTAGARLEQLVRVSQSVI